ncbi:MAG: hypothetical protein GKC10_05220 [Methanosarcinales archaeon]|nr:hypothetical protein [Methanosarcinales archaeon]
MNIRENMKAREEGPRAVHCSTEDCAYCRGSGRVEADDGGEGDVCDMQIVCDVREGQGAEERSCPGCSGQGRVQVALPARKCAYCRGTGQTCQGPCPACGGCGWMERQG